MENGAMFAPEANTSDTSIISDAAAGSTVAPAEEVQSSYFYGGAEGALSDFVYGFGYDDWRETSEEVVRKFIDSFRSPPEIDLGVEFCTPCVLFDEFSSDLDYVFNYTDDIGASMFVQDPPAGMELLTLSEVSDRIWKLDRELMARHLPSYRLPWREEGRLYWHSHAHHLASFVIANPLLELALRGASEDPILRFKRSS